jgi:hypothetical protein
MEIGFDEVGSGEISSAKVSPVEVGSGEFGPQELGLAEVVLGKTRRPKVWSDALVLLSVLLSPPIPCLDTLLQDLKMLRVRHRTCLPL